MLLASATKPSETKERQAQAASEFAALANAHEA
jgi:hypothetical protein